MRTYVYDCDPEFSFIARIEPGKAWLFLPGKTIDLPQVVSASGAKYSAEGYSFWSKGEEATLETDMNQHTGCINNRARAIWEHAKLNGVDFRAVGNEPGWTMEISNKQDLLLVTDYGQQTYRFSSAIMKTELHGRTTIYNAKNDNDMVEIVIRGKPCRDSMSGEAFSTTVSVLLNNNQYTGCGRPLY